MIVRVRSSKAAIAVGCTSQEAEASRSKTWQNHSQGKILACLHKLCWSLLNLWTRSRGLSEAGYSYETKLRELEHQFESKAAELRQEYLAVVLQIHESPERWERPWQSHLR